MDEVNVENSLFKRIELTVNGSLSVIGLSGLTVSTIPKNGLLLALFTIPKLSEALTVL